MLGRARLIDPHRIYPPQLRCEKKMGAEQAEILRRTGLGDVLPSAATFSMADNPAHARLSLSTTAGG
jgi:hypothetical protein